MAQEQTRRMVIGEAGESCALYIAKKLGMPGGMLKRAAQAAYGTENTVAKNTGEAFEDNFPKDIPEELIKEKTNHISRQKSSGSVNELTDKFQIGDSVMIYPDKKIGIVCEKVNEKGVLRVQLPDKKIYINHKRVKLHVKAQELYPEDYDFSIIFETVENRKARHQMERKYVEDLEIRYEE